eukprot:2636665-Rhodomonas_salina.1
MGEPPLPYQPRPEDDKVAPNLVSLADPPPSSQTPAPGAHYLQEHKEFVVRARLNAQPMFDDKLHKNEQ